MNNYCIILRDFIIENFLYGEYDRFQEDAAFIDSGLIDSTGIVDLISFIENKFGVIFGDDEITPENFYNLKSLCAFITDKSSEAVA